MDILCSKLPTKIKLDNRIVDINYDYRTIIRIIQAFEDAELTKEEKLYILIKNLYKSNIEEDEYEKAIKQGMKFIDCGNTNKKNTSSSRVYSFKKDANYIFTGINQTHNIDLSKEKDLHWWKFYALFMDMKPNCMFGELIYYRSREKDGKLTNEEMKVYKKLSDIFDLNEIENRECSEQRKQFIEELRKNSRR